MNSVLCSKQKLNVPNFPISFANTFHFRNPSSQQNLFLGPRGTLRAPLPVRENSCSCSCSDSKLILFLFQNLSSRNLSPSVTQPLPQNVEQMIISRTFLPQYGLVESFPFLFETFLPQYGESAPNQNCVYYNLDCEKAKD